MFTQHAALQLLIQETNALLTRLDRVKSFALHETMVPAAVPSLAAQSAIERHLAQGRAELRTLLQGYLHWLQSSSASQQSLAELQRRFTFLRLRFNAVLTQFDIFADVMTQRSEAQTGIWLAGLDVLATDALTLPGNYYQLPPMVCYLERDHGAAIRRVHTRLPGGGANPVAVIRLPRERMVSHGIASSLVHEVGHQGAALLSLVASFREELHCKPIVEVGEIAVNAIFARWVSEILADFWSVAKVGIASTRGLMGVVSLPRAFVFRTNFNDPHPIPWLRVKLSCAMGNALYPHPQWVELAAIWEEFYPLAGLPPDQHLLLKRLDQAIPGFVTRLVNHRPRSLAGKSLAEALASPTIHPTQLLAKFQDWQQHPQHLPTAKPTLLFAVMGQAQADGMLTAQVESRLLTRMLTQWALQRTLNNSRFCSEEQV